MRLAPLLTAAAALALTAPAAATAAPFGALPFVSLPGGVSCVRATGAPGELVAWAPTGARLERASASGLAQEAVVGLGTPTGCPVAAARSNGAGVVAAPASGAIEVATREPGGTWAGATTIPLTKDTSSDGVAVAVAPSGAAVAAWFEVDRHARVTLRAARRPAGGAFAAPQQVATLANPFFEPGNALAVGMADDGTAVMSWTLLTAVRAGTHASSTRNPLFAAIGPPGAPFGPVQALAPDVESPSLAVAPDGRALAVYFADQQVHVAERAPGGAFAAPETVGDEPDGGADRYAAAALAADGSAVAWNAGGYDDLTIARRSGLGPLGPPIQIVASHAPSEGSFEGNVVSGPDGGRGLPSDDGGAALRAVLLADGRTLLTWASNRTSFGLRWAAARVAVVGADGVSAESSIQGGPLRPLTDVAPVLTDTGVPAVAWGDGHGGRLHLAVEGVPDAATAPSPTIRVGRPLHSALHTNDPLLLPVTCSAACDISAAVGDHHASASLAKAGSVRLRFEGALIAPATPGPAAISIVTGTPGARAVQARTAHVRLRRIPDPPLPAILGLTAVRSGSKIVVRWHTDRGGNDLGFTVTGLDDGKDEVLGDGPAPLPGRTFEHELIDGSRRVHYVTVTVKRQGNPMQRHATVSVR